MSSLGGLFFWTLSKQSSKSYISMIIYTLHFYRLFNPSHTLRSYHIFDVNSQVTWNTKLVTYIGMANASFIQLSNLMLHTNYSHTHTHTHKHNHALNMNCFHDMRLCIHASEQPAMKAFLGNDNFEKRLHIAPRSGRI